MGAHSVTLILISNIILGTLIYNLLTSLGFITILKRLSSLRPTRRDFYECGFKPMEQKPIRVAIQFLIIAIFFILYDTELTFGFPLVSALLYSGLFTILMVKFFFLVLYVSLQVDYNRHALN